VIGYRDNREGGREMKKVLSTAFLVTSTAVTAFCAGALRADQLKEAKLAQTNLVSDIQGWRPLPMPA